MLQSNEVREIMSHATSSEKRAIMFFGALYGLWCALTLAPCTLLAMSLCVGRPWELNACIASILLLVHVACVPLCLRVQRLMLAGTSWARANGVLASEISLFRFSAAKVSAGELPPL